MNILYNTTGLLMFCWYCGFRWNFCSKEPWLFNPINYTTAIVSLIFIIPTFFITNVTFNKPFLCVSIFLLFRNFYYTIEDVIDYHHFPSIRQMTYVWIDVIMFVYVLLWLVKYHKGS